MISYSIQYQRLRSATYLLSLYVAFSASTAFAGDSVPAPRLVGEQVATARQLATLAGCQFAVGEFYIASKNWRDDILPEVIYMQTPQPGIPVLPGSLIACWTFRRASADQAVVTMPDLRRMSVKDALEKLTDLKLSAMPLYSGSTTKGDVLVLDQYPRPGQNVLERTSVHLVAPAAE
jgi:beta-lactam-binding protein with PASTA domain